MAMLTAILFLQEEALTFIPNVQLTVFLILLYSKKLGFFRTSIIVTVHVVLDNLVMGSFNLVYTPAMFVGWMLIPIVINLFCRKIESPIALGIIAAVCAFMYCWCFILPTYLLYNMDPLKYFISDILFEVILAVCAFVSTSILYKPCSKLFDKFRITKTNVSNEL